MKNILLCSYEPETIEDKHLRDFIQQLLKCNKSERMTCREALQHEFIRKNQLTNGDEVNEELMVQAAEAEESFEEFSDGSQPQ